MGGLDQQGEIQGGGVASVSGIVYNLDGAAFTVEVNWGDGDNGQADTEDSSLPPPAPGLLVVPFNVSHYYVVDKAAGDVTVGSLTGNAGTFSAPASETYTIDVTVFPTDKTDNRRATGGTSVTVYEPGPTATVSGPDGYDAFNTPGPFTFTAAANEPWDPSASFTYEWLDGSWAGPVASGEDLCDGTSFNVDGDTLGEMAEGHGGLLVTDGNGAETFTSVSSWWTPASSPDEPTVSIKETGTGGMVFEGDAATFDIHVDAGTSQPTAPLTVDYRTMDGSGAGPTDYQYQSTNGPVQVTFQPGDFSYDQTSGDWTADKTFSIGTTGGVDGGGDKQFSVELSQPNQCQLGETSSATATIVSPCIEITTDAVTNQVVSGVDVNGKPISTTLIVGQRISLTFALPAGITAASEQWTIPGTDGAAPYAIEGYTQAQSVGKETTFLPNDALLRQQTVTYYWTQASMIQAYTVTCSITINGRATPINLTAAFDVYAPVLTFTAQTTSLNSPVGVRNGALQFGTDGSPVQGQHGIEFTIKGLNVLQSETGSVELVQLGNVYSLQSSPNARSVNSSYANIGSTIRSFVARRSTSRLVVRLYPLTPARPTRQRRTRFTTVRKWYFRLHFAASTGFTSPVILRHT